MAWYNFFGNSTERKLQSIADSTWANRCLWDWVSPGKGAPDWVAVGGFVQSMPSRFDHMSANGYFDRNAVAQRWIRKIEHSAIDNMRDEDALLERWARIDCVPFWDDLAKTMNAQLQRLSELDACWNRVLLEAGEMGNCVVFQRAPDMAIAAYVQRDRLVHPSVGTWLMEQGFCTKEHLRSQVDARRFGLDQDMFAGCQRGEPMAPEFIAQWCMGLLKHYGLDASQKVRVVGQAMLVFGQQTWQHHVEPYCLEYTAGIDMALLRAIFADTDERIQDPLEESLRLASFNPQQRYQPDRAVEVVARASEPHEGLAMLLNLAPPQNRLQLYFAGHSVRQMEKGLCQESLDLPQLV